MVSARARKQEARAYAERHGLSYAQALQRLRGSELSYPRAQVIYFGSNYGGAGKTTTTLLAAFALRNAGKRVLLVDGDLRDGQLRYFAGQAFGHSFLDLSTLLDSGQKLTEATLRELVHHDPLSSMDFLYAPPRPHWASESMADDFLRVLPVLRESYDYILIDNSVNYASSAKQFLRAADQVVIHTWPSLDRRDLETWMEASGYGSSPVEVRRILKSEGELTDEGVILLPHIPRLIRGDGLSGSFRSGELAELTEPYGLLWSRLFGN